MTFYSLGQNHVAAKCMAKTVVNSTVRFFMQTAKTHVRRTKLAGPKRSKPLIFFRTAAALEERPKEKRLKKRGASLSESQREDSFAKLEAKMIDTARLADPGKTKTIQKARK